MFLFCHMFKTRENVIPSSIHYQVRWCYFFISGWYKGLFNLKALVILREWDRHNLWWLMLRLTVTVTRFSSCQRDTSWNNSRKIAWVSVSYINGFLYFFLRGALLLLMRLIKAKVIFFLPISYYRTCPEKINYKIFFSYNTSVSLLNRPMI